MANPKMWKVVTETNCDRGSRLEHAGYDDESVSQVSAGEEDQSAEGWEGA